MTRDYTCELCGLTFDAPRTGRLPRWCPDDRTEGRRHYSRPHTPVALLSASLAQTVVNQRLAIEQAIHALNAAALARQLQWDDATWLDAALEALIDIATVQEATAAA